MLLVMDHRDYTLTSALRDSRFNPVSLEEVIDGQEVHCYPGQPLQLLEILECLQTVLNPPAPSDSWFKLHGFASLRLRTSTELG